MGSIPTGDDFWWFFFCSSLCKDLSDNLTETSVVKNSNITLHSVSCPWELTFPSCATGINMILHTVFGMFVDFLIYLGEYIEWQCVSEDKIWGSKLISSPSVDLSHITARMKGKHRCLLRFTVVVSSARIPLGTCTQGKIFVLTYDANLISLIDNGKGKLRLTKRRDWIHKAMFIHVLFFCYHTITEKIDDWKKQG